MNTPDQRLIFSTVRIAPRPSMPNVSDAISKGGQQRCVYPVNKTLLQAMDRYALYRVKRDIGTSGESAYRQGKRQAAPRN